MTNEEIAELFRAAVTCIVNDQPATDAYISTDRLDHAGTIELAGLGAAMTANLVKVIAHTWEVSPGEAWKIIVRVGMEDKLPGMESG